MKNYILISVILFLMSGCALQRDIITLEDRIFSLERYKREQQDMRATSDKNQQETQKGLRSKYADLKLSVNQIREDMNMLNGKFEEVDYYLNNQKGVERDLAGGLQEIKDTISSMTDRLVRLEQYMGFEPSENFKTPGDLKPAGDKKFTERELYDLAKQALDKGKTDAAREGFQTFLKKYPKSKNADNAQFWIGEIFYREKWYEKAILEYQKVIENYPKGNKVPAAYLKQGFSFQNLGEKANARLILKELISKYPNSKEAESAKKKIKIFN